MPLAFSSSVSGSRILTITLSKGTPTHPSLLLTHVLLPVDTTGAVCVCGGERGDGAREVVRGCEEEGMCVCVCMCVYV